MNENLPTPAALIVSVTQYLKELGKTKVTFWRWSKKGWIKPINISGRLYLSRAAIQEFERRALAGEFSQEPKPPKRQPGISDS